MHNSTTADSVIQNTGNEITMYITPVSRVINIATNAPAYMSAVNLVLIILFIFQSL